MVDEIVVRFEDAARKPVVAQELPDVFDRRARDISVAVHNGDVGWHDEALRHVPASLIDQEHGVCAGRDRRGDLRKVEVHRLGIAGGRIRAAPLPCLGQTAPKI